MSVAKVDMDVGLLSEEDRASAGAMAVSMWGEDAGRTTSGWMWQESHPSGVDEVSMKWCGRGGRGGGVEEMGPSHPDDVGSEAEWSGPNTGTGSRAGVDGARIRETRAEHARTSGRAQPLRRPSATLSVLIMILYKKN